MIDGRSIVIPVVPRQEVRLFEPLATMDPIRFERAEFNLDNLFESTWKQVHEVERTGTHPRHLLLGRDFYWRFMEERSKCMGGYFHFQVPPEYNARVQPDSFAAVFRGLNVHCIPWMEGVVVVPQLDEYGTPANPQTAGVNDWTVQAAGEVMAVPAEALPADGEINPEAVRGMLRRMRSAFNAWFTGYMTGPSKKVPFKWTQEGEDEIDAERIVRALVYGKDTR